MSDDTTTWLKKNSAINPLRRSLKTSLRFHVPSSDMNTSIMSNPDKVKDQGLFIPRMLRGLDATASRQAERSNMQMRKSRAYEFKVPELVVPKPAVKKESGSGVKVKKIPTPNRTRKSLLPVAKTKPQAGEKVKNNPTKVNLPRSSYIAGSSNRTAKRDLIKKVVELSEMKRKEEAESQVKVVSGDSSVLRSILKKRASLRRSSQLSSKKPKAKKVLFDGFENSDGEKENDVNGCLQRQNDFNTALDEPTVFLNFPNGADVDESPLETKQPLNWSMEESKTLQHNDIKTIMKLWDSYKQNLDTIQTERSSVEESFESLLQHSLTFQKEYQAYKETSEEMYSRLSKLGKEIEENLKKVLSGDRRESTPRSKKPTGKKVTDKSDKIKMSDRSKAIKKNSARKSVPLLKKDFLNDMEDSFSFGLV